MAKIDEQVKKATSERWQRRVDATKGLRDAVNNGIDVDSSELDTLWNDFSFDGKESFACDFCAQVIKEYNQKHGTSHTVTFREMCFSEDCPSKHLCKEDDQKWEAVQIILSILYFHNGWLLKGEGNRYPLCEKWCSRFTECEQLVPTDTVNFLPLEDNLRKVKHIFCINALADLIEVEDFDKYAVDNIAGKTEDKIRKK